MPATTLVKSVALAGAGTLGSVILPELVKAGFETTVLTRRDSKRDSPFLSAKAAKEAGVKLFVPGEFGNPTTNIEQAEVHPIMYGKKQIQDLLKSVGLPTLLVFNGPFSDTTFNAFLGFDAATGRIRLVGKGDTPISWTTRLDVARFLAHYLSTLTSFPSASESAVLRIEGDRKTYSEVVDIYCRLQPDQNVQVS
ncbi:nmrA-like domain containing protein [Rhodotorula toruloides]|uniref:NmrA-like domain containing protein n=1 Tax=Rhodotorula toruloides TaxID=5286 RepID=A0A511KCT3_RHOTO|nr:nmrA-like domain containing protein [Rhodotorula toruloides]